MEHGGEYPDTMPQAIKLVDAKGRSCIYVPITQDGKSSTAKATSSIWRMNDHRSNGVDVAGSPRPSRSFYEVPRLFRRTAAIVAKVFLPVVKLSQLFENTAFKL
jgi:hypothetical protein